MDLFQQPKNATDFLLDINKHKAGHMKKAEFLERWKGHTWSSQGMRDWANWLFRENVR